MTAIAEAEEVEVAEEEMVEALAHSAEHERTTPEKLLERLRESGRDEMVREDMRAQKAIEVVAESATPIPIGEAEARQGESRGAGEILDAGGQGESRRALDPGRRVSSYQAPPAAFYKVPVDEPSGSDGGRADLSRRARLRHLLAPAGRADHLPRHARYRRHRQPYGRPADPPEVGGSRQGRQPLRQLAGRLLYAGLAIYDTMRFITPDVQTICVGVAMSMGALLLAGGAAGKRMALPNSKILIHQVSAGFQGQATDIEIHAKEIIDVRRRLDEIIAKHTGQPFEKVTKDTERDYFMSAEEAKEYNIVDRVIEHH